MNTSCPSASITSKASPPNKSSAASTSPLSPAPCSASWARTAVAKRRSSMRPRPFAPDRWLGHRLQRNAWDSRPLRKPGSATCRKKSPAIPGCGSDRSSPTRPPSIPIGSSLRRRALPPLACAAGRPHRRLSTGQLQTVGIVLALGHEPELLVLDEPVASLDPSARRQFFRTILEMLESHERTILFSTHITSDLERVANRVAILEDGQIRFHGELDELKDRVKRLRISSRHDLPASFAVPGSLRCEVTGAQRHRERRQLRRTARRRHAANLGCRHRDPRPQSRRNLRGDARWPSELSRSRSPTFTHRLFLSAPSWRYCFSVRPTDWPVTRAFAVEHGDRAPVHRVGMPLMFFPPFLVRHVKTQFGHSRSRLTPGFAVPHLATLAIVLSLHSRIYPLFCGLVWPRSCWLVHHCCHRCADHLGHVHQQWTSLFFVSIIFFFSLYTERAQRWWFADGKRPRTVHAAIAVAGAALLVAWLRRLGTLERGNGRLRQPNAVGRSTVPAGGETVERRASPPNKSAAARSHHADQRRLARRLARPRNEHQCRRSADCFALASVTGPRQFPPSL